MDTKLLKLLSEVKLKEKQSYSNLLVYPFFYQNGNKLDYICIDEAFSNKKVEITEIDEGGSVPELFLKNNSDDRVLLLDGEELLGAKQNRILNTSILIEKQDKTKIPVSCVEAGRWGYNSASFSSSDRMSPSSLKMRKSESVSRSLSSSAGMSYRSDQHEVWNEVERLSSSARVYSPSSAMSDVFDSRTKDIEDYVKCFKPEEKQNGMIVFINNKIVGLEYISNARVFPFLFKKLIRGYAMDALLDQETKSETRFGKLFENFIQKKMVKEFFDKIASSNEEKFKSVGLGDDHRLTTKDLVGSALSYEEEIVHLSVISRNISASNDDYSEFESSNYIRRSSR